MTRVRVLIAAVITVAVVTAVVAYLSRDQIRPFLAAESCRAEVDGLTVALEIDQAQNAGLIAGLAVQRGMPARAVSIALATAYQESKIRNLDHGDRDSLGLFQQRPSQGWGSADQLQDPVFATHAFYDALAKVDGYERMEITVAAQEVQRSGFPDAYADHEADARVLASALTGHSPHAFWCSIEPPEGGRPASVGTAITEIFGDAVGTPEVVKRRVATSVPGREHGWSLAQVLVSQADDLAIEQVAYRRWVWTAGTDTDGWTQTDRNRTDVVATVAR